MSSWFERPRVRCPACQYDVAQTLTDGFDLCPECGGPISIETCARYVDAISRRARRLIYAAWIAPLVPSLLVFLNFRVLLLAPLGVGLVYGSWVWIERWLEPRGAWLRAIGPALAILIIDAALGFVLMLAVLTAAEFAR